MNIQTKESEDAAREIVLEDSKEIIDALAVRLNKMPKDTLAYILAELYFDIHEGGGALEISTMNAKHDVDEVICDAVSVYLSRDIYDR